MRMLRRCAATAVLTALLPAAALAAPSVTSGSVLTAGAGIATVRTRGGAVQGFVDRDVSTFRGIPYAQAERFMPPRPAAAWTGVRSALSYGAICPQPVSPHPNDIQTFISDTQYWPQSEDCQNLNIWTPGLDGRKRPVMVWLHGGGYFSGSSHENNVYDGHNLSQTGDVVVVSLNHRLNILGFLDLSAYGDAYRSSGEVGMMDIVAALQWVRDNIAAFGGDPSNVTIFGQSGGGGKVSTLLGAPSAHGLFQKAIIESGAMPPPAPSGGEPLTRKVAEAVFRHAGLKPGDVEHLKTLPYDQLSAAGDQALREVSASLGGGGGGPLGFPRINWEPVVDGVFLPERPYAASAPAVSANVPLLIGSNLNEFALLNPQIAGRQHWGMAEFKAYLARTYGADRVEALVAAYRSAYPELPPGEWAGVEAMMRAGTLHLAALKSAQAAPVYNYLFAWRSPILDEFWGAGHSMELAFVFDNVERGEQSTGGGPEVARLSEEVSRAWVDFARTGAPTPSGLGAWPRFTAAAPATLVIDAASTVRVGHDAELIRLMSQPPAGPGAKGAP